MPIAAESTATALFMPAIIALVSLMFGAILNAMTSRISQRREFDHRFRIEREYELCVELWEKLFELRRAVSQLSSAIGTNGVVSYTDDQIIAAFNSYQSVVRRSEPFLCSTIYEPAREIARLANQMIGNEVEQREISEKRGDNIGDEADERLANMIINRDEQKSASFERIEELFQKVSKAIRVRVRP